MKEKTKHWLKITGMGLLALFAWSFVVHVGWNMAIPDIFGLEPIRFKQALGLTLIGATVSLLFHRPVRWSLHSHSA